MKHSTAMFALVSPLLGVHIACASPHAILAPVQDSDDSLRVGDPEGAQAYDVPFFADARYSEDITNPGDVLGQATGSRMATDVELRACFEAWAAESERLVLVEHGASHEGRAQYHAVITSPRNHERLEALLADNGRLFDPRDLSVDQGRAVLERALPFAWMGYSIHGDETSGCDASLALAYRLVAGTDPATLAMLDEVVTVIDPIMNPDGRQRILTQSHQMSGYTKSLDHSGLLRGRWPRGRGNHYLFDMNRDWIAGTQPETVGRWEAILRYHPQLLVDAHEMGGLDTYLFYPQADPLNPHSPADLSGSQKVLGGAIAQAFDAHSWDYYTREWADGWAPFYSDAWAGLTGAIGILYEQGAVIGNPLRRASGTVLTYRESVHHQAVASWACLEALRENADWFLERFLADARRVVASPTGGSDVFVVRHNGNTARTSELVRILVGQGIEVERSLEGFFTTGATDRFGAVSAESVSSPAGSLIIRAAQPMGRAVRAYCEFDTKLTDEALQSERESLERKNESKIYDTMAWSLPHALDLDALWGQLATDVRTEFITELAGAAGGVVASSAEETPVAWAVDATTDDALVFAVRAMDSGLQVHASDKAFTSAGVEFSRGSLLVRRHENDVVDVDSLVAAAAVSAGIRAHALTTGLSADEGPDLGGGHFHLLTRPRVAIVGNAPTSSDTFGHLWHYLDTRLGLVHTILDAQSLSSVDLRRYNVLVLPPGAGAIASDQAEALETWVRAGGTLVACGNTAASLTSERAGLSAVVLRRHALEELESYAAVAARERRAWNVTVDAKGIWSGAAVEASAPKEDKEEEFISIAHVEGESAEDRDAWMRRFSPHGAMLLGEARSESWLTAGAGARVPILFGGSSVYLPPAGVETAVRFSPARHVRLSGLLWPEAAERVGDSAWLTRESMGAGQIILFTSMPSFRGFHFATARFFGNAVVLGPGLGASAPLPW
ncbi:MAG: hypothetical protein CMJ98_02120 [Planctomycetes bacterium]|nr:hypothetical protein [Planctomycetota bacterium]HJM55947.1 M14 family zinc carboxypeptidase [Planctomycetota bacterium]